MELMQANHQWANRPDDERFLSLDALFDRCRDQMEHSMEKDVSTREIVWEPAGDDTKGLVMRSPSGSTFAPTNHAFNQACQRVKAPADYLRSLASPLVADCLNYGYGVDAPKDARLLLYQNGGPATLNAITSTGYGRIWQAQFAQAMRSHFGDGVTGRWHIPGEFNRYDKPITKESTTLYAGDRDAWIFLCDGDKSIEVKNRRNGQVGHMQRGFFAWNSDVGLRSIGAAGFWYDYMCANHIIWGAFGFEEIRIRHTVTAPDRWVEELLPALEAYTNSSTVGMQEAIANAQAARIDKKVSELLANRFGPRMFERMQAQHKAEEDRPIETMFDAVTAATAVARGMPFIGPRVDLEREAGKLLELVAA